MRRPRVRRAKGARAARSALGLVLVGAALLALSGLALAGFLLRPAQTDRETLCRLDRPPAAQTIILIDATDKLEPRHRRRLRAAAVQEHERLAEGDRFTIIRLDARRPDEPRILFSKCLPKPPDQTNPLFENPQLAQQHWDAAFENALQSALRSAQASGRQSASPIIASLRAAGTDPDFTAQSVRRRIVLVSDLLEYEPNGFSLYAPDASFEAWQNTDPRGPPDLDGIDIRVVRLDRPDHVDAQTRAQTFWQRFLDASGAHEVSFDLAP